MASTLPIGRLQVPSYPALLCLGVSVGMIAQNAAANAAGLPSGRVYVATLLLLPVAVLGARLLYVVTHWDAYRAAPRLILDRSAGGMALYGGLVVMLPASVAVLATLDVAFWPFWDVTVYLILIGMAGARIGCLFHGCCAGRITASRWGLRPWGAPQGAPRRVPVQLMEASVALLLLAGAVAIGPGAGPPGALFLLVAVGYGVARSLLQSLRSEPGRMTAQLPSLAVVVLAAAALGLLWR